jgi:hypothetical protein
MVAYGDCASSKVVLFFKQHWRGHDMIAKQFTEGMTNKRARACVDVVH